MHYFDLAFFDVDKSFSKRLGYEKVYEFGKDVILGDRYDANKTMIVESSNTSELSKAIKGRAVGVIIKDNELEKRVIEDASSYGKPILISTSTLISDYTSRARNIYRAKRLLAFSMRSGADVLIVTMAHNREFLLSYYQLMSIARFLGAGDAYAKKMVSKLGDIL